MKRVSRVFGGLAIFFLLSLCSSIANAACPVILNVRGPASIVYDPNGSEILWEGSVYASGGTINCPTPSGWIDWRPGGMSYTYYNEWYLGKGSAVNNIYESGIPGIGYRVVLTGACGEGVYWPTFCVNIWSGNKTVNPHTVKVQLIRVGDVSVGGTLSGEFGRIEAENGPVLISYIWSPEIIVRPSKPSCRLVTKSATVYLGSVSIRDFKGIGSVSASKPIDLEVLCSGGNPGVLADVRATLTDGTDSANRSTSLTLTRASTAGGVSIQVLKGTELISYGPASNADGNLNQWWVGSTENGVLRFRLDARYVQTGPMVTPGSANGAAIITMNYR